MELKRLLVPYNQYYFAGLSEAYHLVYYLPDGDDVTDWTTRVLNFKRKSNIDDYNEITRLTTEAIHEAEIKFDFVTRILGHKELKAQNGAAIIDFAKAIAKETGALYIPQLLNKTRETTPLHFLGRAERQAEIEGVFFVNTKFYDMNNKSLLVVDDISTSCTTIAEMIKILKKQWPDINVYLLCLARTIHGNPNANENL